MTASNLPPMTGVRTGQTAAIVDPSQRVSHTRLLEILDYNSDTGDFTWKVATSDKIRIGTRAGTLSRGRRQIGIDGKLYRAARLAWFYVHGEWPPYDVDHKDLDASHDWIDNLRLATCSENGANRKMKPTNKCGFKGVSVHTQSGLYRARLQMNGKKYCQYFSTIEEAHQAYAVKAKEFCGEFARAA